MRCILRNETDPYFNIAAEEFILKNSDEDVFMLWRNDPAVIIGKHQNAFAEINHEFVRKKKIAVIRRISGGGAVYHDRGNLNFTFITHGEPEKLVDFHKFTFPVTEALKKWDLPVAIGNRNSLYINGFKISGNAEHVFRNKVLHHGTLLFNSELSVLEKAIHPPAISYVDKAVKSVRSKVANITDFLNGNITIQEFAGYIMNYITRSNIESYLQPFTKHENEQITALMNEKYLTWAWNYGYSPKFSFSTRVSMTSDPGDAVALTLWVNEGYISEITPDITGNTPPEGVTKISDELNELVTLLKGTPLREDAIRDKLSGRFSTQNIRTLIGALFAGGTAEHLHNMNV